MSALTPRNWGAAQNAPRNDFLTRRGLRTIARNYRTRGGEIDLVMTDDDEIVFVEVRYRSRTDFGDGAATVDFNKQQRLVSAPRGITCVGDSDERTLSV